MGLSQGTFGLSITDVNRVSTSFGFEEKIQTGDIDTTNDWTETLTSTGTRTIVNAQIRCDTGATLGSTVRISKNAPLYADIRTLGSDEAFNKFQVEFYLTLTNIANVDEATTFWGMGGAATATRASNDIFGFIVNSGEISAISDENGSETVTAISSSGTRALYRIEVDSSSYKFYKDGTLVATHSGSGRLIEWLQFFIENDAAATARIEIAQLRAWFEK